MGWLGDSRKVLRSFPEDVQDEAGFELWTIQSGSRATDSKPMPSVGAGVEEIRLWVESGTYRVIYINRMAEAVYVLHAFQKKTQATSPRDIGVARRRLEQLLKFRKQKSLL